MLKFIGAIAPVSIFLLAAPAMAAPLSVTGFSHTATSVTFTLNGSIDDTLDDLGQSGIYNDLFSIAYYGDIVAISESDEEFFGTNSWSDTPFANGASVLSNGNTGQFVGSTPSDFTNVYTWARFTANVASEEGSGSSVTVTFGEAILNPEASNYSVVFVLGSGDETQAGRIELAEVSMVSTVPLPAGLPLMAGGLGLLGALRLRRGRHAA